VKTLLLSMISPAYHELGVITRPNHMAYAAAQGYESRCLSIEDSPNPYGGIPGELARIQGVLDAFEEGFDQVLYHDADTLFTNHTLAVEDIMPGAPVVIAKEELRWWPLNFGVVLWRKTPEAIALLKRIIADEKTWSAYQWYVQTHVWNLFKTDDEVRRTILLVPARVLNSTAQQCPSRWQVGDFLIHLLAMPLQERVKVARMILDIAWPCDGTYLK
jgi:hypothetical protein